MSEWQRIDTAPKDGSELLGWHQDYDVVVIRWTCADYFLTDTEKERQGWQEDDLLKEDWFCADFCGGERLEGDLVPTHWMSLPQPPEV